MSDIAFTNAFVAESGSGLQAGSLQAGMRTRDRVVGVLDRVVFVGLMLLLVLVVIPFGSVEPWWIALYECAIFGLGALWIVEAAVSSAWRVREPQLLAPVAALLAFTFLQSLTFSWLGRSWFNLPSSYGSISADPFETRLVFFKLFALFLTAALLLRYLSTRRRLRTLIHVIIVIAVASAVFGILRQALQHTEAGFVLPYLRRGSGFGQFVNKSHFAFLMEMASGLATGLLLGGAVRRERLLFYVSAVALMWTALVLTSSRGALLSSMSQVVFLLVILRMQAPGASISPAGFRRRLLPDAAHNSASDAGSITKPSFFRSIASPLALSLCLLTVIATAAVWVGGDLLVTRLASLPGEIKIEAPEPHAGVRRREVWVATWNLIKAHPIAGSGLGAYGVAITRFHDASGKFTPEAAHNDYLELLASGGLIGSGLVAWLGFAFVKRVRRLTLSGNTFQRAVCLGALTGIFGVMAHSVVDFGLHVMANVVIFIALMVLAVKATSDLNSGNLEGAGTRV